MGLAKKYYSLMDDGSQNVVLEFIINGNYVGTATGGALQLQFLGAYPIHVDYGDGIIQDLSANTDFSLSHNYASSGIWKIIITTPNPEKISLVNFFGLNGIGNLSTAFARLSSLGILRILNNSFDLIPDSVLKTPSLSNINISNNPSFGGIVPSAIFDATGLITFEFSNNSNSGTYSSRNLNRFNELPNLVYLNLNNVFNIYGDFLPSNIYSCVNINALQVSQSNGLRFTSSIASMIGLGLLYMNACVLYGNALDSNLSLIPNLVYLNLTFSDLSGGWDGICHSSSIVTLYMNVCNLSDTLEPNLRLLTTLKNLDISQNSWTNSQTNNAINQLYTLVTTYATGSGSTGNFRGMSINLNYNATPTGTYQAPSGFVLGGSNGTPASPAEKIYVLNNNYGHGDSYT